MATHFKFPDVADFPENTEPVEEEDFVIEDWRADFGKMMEWILKRNKFDPEELRILKGQAWRIQTAAQLYEKLPYPRDSKLEEKGVLIRHMDTSALEAFFADDIKELENRQPKENLGIDEIDCAKVRKDDAAITLVQAFLQSILPHAQAYRGRPYGVRDIAVHLSRPGDRHHYQQFRDCKTTTKLLNLHLDPKPGILKAIIYLGQVDKTNGPFQCIPGSNHWKRDPLEQIFAWGNSIGNYCHTPKHRRVANAFPARYRGNAIIGRLIPDGSEVSKFLLRNMRTMTSKKGNVFLFDPCFMFHRGGQCQSGNRINLQVRLA